MRGREHEALLVFVPGFRVPELVPEIRRLRGRMPEWLRPMLVGPVSPAFNGGVSFVFLPDGSQAHGSDAERASRFRRELLGMATARWTDPESGLVFEGCPVVLAQYGERTPPNGSSGSS